MRACSLLLLPAVLFAQGPPAQLPQRLLFVGESGREARTAAFAQLLGQHFAAVQTTTHAAFARTALNDVDVVLLDWHQDGQTMDQVRCPLGDLADWDRPLVLLGSAGLRLAMTWDVFGGVG